MKKFLSCLCLAAACLLAGGCHDVFSYHPYDGRFPGPYAINRRGTERIERECGGKDTLRIAFCGDNHGNLGALADAVGAINRRTDIDFVVHLGDMTDTGTTREFEWARDRLERLRPPYVAMIGNHDFLGTGDEVYGAMFGPTNFSFIAGGVKFVCINTCATEYDYLAAVPDFNYMEYEATARSGEFSRTVLCMHALPGSDQFNNNVLRPFGLYACGLPGLLLCIGGHNHHFACEDIYANGMLWFTMPAIGNRSYMIFTITPTGYDYATVDF